MMSPSLHSFYRPSYKGFTPAQTQANVSPRYSARTLCRILAGLILCVPGGLVIAIGVLFLMPGIAVLFWPGLEVVASSGAAPDARQSVSWPMKDRGEC